MLAGVTPLGKDRHPGAFQTPPQLGIGRDQPSGHHHLLGTPKRPPLAGGEWGGHERLVPSHYGEAGAERGAPLPFKQQVVRKLPGAHLPPEVVEGTNTGQF